jgi:UDP-N-acetylmuramoyl-L-alanyl-D-glutamate--2,6-diaminopimelate ligase
VLSVALLETGRVPPSAALIGRLTATRRAGLGLALAGDFGEAILESPLWGRFNAENLVVATGILLAHGLELSQAAAALAAGTAPPGRMQVIRREGRGPEVIVDFAHTPDALEQALNAVRAHSSGRIWCVFGCGGDRDRGKRAPMGATAVSLADQVVLTDDNPRNEDPDAIVADILAGIDNASALTVIRDRAAAIAWAISGAAENDVVLIAGKGHETGQEQCGMRRPFIDAAVVRAALEQLP